MDKSDKSDKGFYMKMYINEYGTKIYKNSKGYYHREDGPALEYTNGDKFWYKEGRWHRENSPAREWIDGNKEWWKKGKCHRIDGPAWEYLYGEKAWFILDKELVEKDFNSWISRIMVFI